jgi:lauroyl/myristoyl acyltransferase
MEDLIQRVREEYGVEIKNEKDMTSAWKLVETLEEKGWVVYIITGKGRKQVDAWHPNFGSLFAQFGENPGFSSILEGICNVALLVRELEKHGKV